ncbi:hypothetical protein M413DRAFT_440744 [Hebeloma cylindrosporum]|uniref:Uncharacterized protein n=1 Tax=Hebeloma cylindrosporum TaxID=76867 RepID=A0A0C2YBS4_HEBCY|nr:hypothetical protein M413DRAFT_440744 [Hebeloma cylindrosporum h7]
MTEKDTSTPPSKMGAGLGKKIRGAAEIVHGAGDTLRGTMLGTVESLGKEIGLRSKDDDIAQQGKLEMERGLENWKGSPTTSSAISPSQSATGYQAQGTTGSAAVSGATAPHGGGLGGPTGEPGLVYASGDEHAHASTGAHGPGSSYPTHPTIVGSPPEPQGLNTQQPRYTRKFGSGFEHEGSGVSTEGRALDQQQYPPPAHYGVSPQSQAYQPNPTGTVHPKS